MLDLGGFTNLSDLSEYVTHADMLRLNRGLLARALPKINGTSIELREMIHILHHIAQPIVRLIEYSPEDIDKQTARQYISILGFIASMVERHSQLNGYRPGEGIEALGCYMGSTLTTLSHIAKHPPRDSHYTYWLWNNDPVINFNGDRGENLFRDAVVTQSENLDKACNALMILTDEGYDLCDPQTSTKLVYAKQQIEGIHDQYRRFQEKDADGERGMTVYSFTARLRTFMPAYPIADRMWTGVNAANLREQMHFDYLMGYPLAWYAPIVEKRLPYMTTEDSYVLNRDMYKPSLTDRILGELNLNPDFVKTAHVSDLATWIGTKASPELFQMLLGYSALHHEYTQLSAYHWAQIVYYLKRASQHLTPEQQVELRHMPIQPDSGTGGSSLDEVHHIFEMRQKHPIIKPLVDAIDMVHETIHK